MIVNMSGHTYLFNGDDGSSVWREGNMEDEPTHYSP